MQEFENKIRKLLIKAPIYSKSNLVRIERLSGDASTREYYRLHFSAKETAILMHVNPAKGPSALGAFKTQDLTFIEMQSFYAAHGLPVPTLYLNQVDQGIVVVEDIGDLALCNFPLNENSLEIEKIKDSLGQQSTLVLYKRAIDLIKQLQTLAPDPRVIAFNRHQEFEQFKTEADEFLIYYADSKEIKKPAREVVNRVIISVCEALASHPRVLSHRDFMSWNLHVKNDGSICMIDFQDSFLASPLRDLVSLINDRGIDQALGASQQKVLIEYFSKQVQPQLSVESLMRMYNETLLQWDFRVSGRFVLLTEKKGVERYKQWLPGTLRRLGRSLARSQKYFSGVDDCLEILSKLSPEIKEGIQDPWDLSF